MSRRSSSTGGFGAGVFENISTNIGSVVTVADNIDSIKQLMDMPGFEDLLIDVRETLDFTNITVVSGEEASWNSGTKVLTVPTVKGDKGDNLTMSSVVDNGDNTFTWGFSDGTVFTTPDLRGAKGDTGDQGQKGEKGEKGDDAVPVTLTRIMDNGDYTFDWEFSDGYIYTTPTLRGHRGLQGEKGDAVSLDGVEHIGDGIFTWTFSDGTVFTTPRLKGEQGPKGATGPRGQQGDRGIGVHHLRRTSTTDIHGVFGSFGEIDTYTFYGDADEEHVLGWFDMRNGISDPDELGSLGLMLRRVYDEDEDGIVDNSTRLGGKKLEELGLFFSVGSYAEIFDTDSGIDEGDIVLIRDNGTGKWVLVSIDQKEPDLVTTTLMSQKLEEFVGDESELTTTAKRLPTAINELDEEIGDTTTLTTTSKNIVPAINELDEEIGDTAALTTTSKNIVPAINELDGEVGDVSTLVTDEKTVVPAINELHEDARLETIRVNKQHFDHILLTKDSTGFVDRTSSTLLFDKNARTITLQPTGGSFSVYESGKEFVITAPVSVTVPNVSEGQYILYDTVTEELVLGGMYPGYDALLVAYYLWNASTQDFVIEGDERHNVARDTTWHAAQHSNEGLVWRSGGNATFTLEDPTDVTFKISSPVVVADEDLVHIITQGTRSEPFTQDIEGGVFPVMYIEDVDYKQVAPGTDAFLSDSAGILYNEIVEGVGSLKSVPDGKFVNYFLMAGHCQRNPIKIVVGRNLYDSVQEASTESLLGYGINWPEFSYMYNLVFYKDETITENAGKVLLSRVLEPTRPLTALNSSGYDSHEALFDKEKPNQHPIGAITGLQSELVKPREWSEATVTKEEAEEGTSLERRAFTAERVRQSTEAWWVSNSSDSGKVVVTGTPIEARGALELGNSSVLNVGTEADTVAAGDDSRFVDYLERIEFLEDGIDGGDLDA